MAQTIPAGSIAGLLHDDELHPKILVVDDYDANILIAGSYLENFGYEYDVAKSGMDALNKIRESKYLAILMDIQMPELDGMETTMLIRNLEYKQKRKRQPIIAMTAHSLAGDCQACFAAGMDAYLSKPFNPNELEAMLNHFSGMQSSQK
jgi:CheY-like chemotaxis protein